MTVRRVRSLFVILLVTWGYLAVVSARDLSEIRHSGVLLLATEGATPPFNYFQNGKLTGFDFEIGNAVAARMGLQPAWTTASFDTLLMGLNQNRYDLVVMDQAITPRRQSAVDFSKPYVCSGGIIVALPGGPRRAAELASRIVGVQVGTTYLEAAQRIPGIGRVITFQKDTDALQNLLAQRTDAWVSDRLTATYLARVNPSLHLQLGDLLFEERDGIAIAKGNDSLREAVNLAISGILSDGTYSRLAIRFFGRDIRCDQQTVRTAG